MMISSDYYVDGIDKTFFSKLNQNEVSMLPPKFKFLVKFIFPNFEELIEEKLNGKKNGTIIDIDRQELFWPQKGI